MKHTGALIACICIFFCWLNSPAALRSQSAPKPELIRDTDIAERKESVADSTPKERNPLLAEKNIDIGNFYFKKKNYAAAIQRYLDAIEYHPGSLRAYEALARAYEKNDEIPKAIEACRDFILKNPDSPKAAEFRSKLIELEKKMP